MPAIEARDALCRARTGHGRFAKPLNGFVVHRAACLENVRAIFILNLKAANQPPPRYSEVVMCNQMVRNRLFDDVFGDFAPGFFVRPLRSDKLPAVSGIKIDVKENGNAYTVLAEMPGVSKEDIQVSVDGSVVTLQAEIKQADEQKDGEKVLRSERYYGAVARSFQLPQEIDESQAKAKFDNGVLALTLPKKQAAAAQKITIE